MTWAYRELASVHLGDARLDMRLMGMAEGFSEHPEASCAEALGEAGAKAAYRLLDNERVEAGDILEPHAGSTAERAGAYGSVLALQDTTEINLTGHPSTTGLGYLGSPQCRGLLLHSMLVVSPTGLPLGVVWQECWARPQEQLGKSQQRRQLPLEEKESQRWLNGLAAADKTLPEHPHVVVVGDRESDIFALFAAPRPDRIDLLVRVCRETRCVEHTLKYLNKILEAEPIRGGVQIDIPPHPGRQERQARLSVRWCRLDVCAPRHGPKGPSVALTFILVEEIDPPPGEAPVRWLLATTLEVTSLDDALRYVQWYAFRWLIERFHFVLKSGCRIEQRQFETAKRMQRAIPLFSIVAWRLLHMTLLAREKPDASCTTILNDVEWRALHAATHPRGPLPAQPPTIRAAVRMIAKLGGFLGRKGDGEPGPKTLWRGWRRLCDIVQGWQLKSTCDSPHAGSTATCGQR